MATTLKSKPRQAEILRAVVAADDVPLPAADHQD